MAYNSATDPYAAYRYPTSPGSPEMNPEQRVPSTSPGFTDPNHPQPTAAAPATAAKSGSLRSVLEPTLMQRYGGDAAKVAEQLDYFDRRDAETRAEGDPRDASYWNMRASGVNEAQYAIDEAKKAQRSTARMPMSRYRMPSSAAGLWNQGLAPELMDQNTLIGMMDGPTTNASVPKFDAEALLRDVSDSDKAALLALLSKGA